jgi:anti-sigma factor RsiW
VTHSEIRAQLSDYLDRDLHAAQRSQLEAHLESCPDCRTDLAELSATVALLRRLPDPEPAPELASLVMRRIARGEGRESRVVVWLRRAAEPRFVAPLAAGLAGLFLLLETGDTGHATPPGAAAMLAVSEDAPLRMWDELHAEPPARARAAAGLVSGVPPVEAFEAYARRAAVRSLAEHAQQRARLEQFARTLRGAGHPHSASLASHFEPRSGAVLADWQPR